MRLQFGIRHRANKATLKKHGHLSYKGNFPFELRHLIIAFIHKVKLCDYYLGAMIRMCCSVGNVETCATLFVVQIKQLRGTSKQDIIWPCSLPLVWGCLETKQL